MATRRVIRLSGPETIDFLQGLVTNDVNKIDEGLVYAALLTPQGKYLGDFFLKKQGDDVLLDLAEEQADDLIRRLTMYKLRSKVSFEPTTLSVVRGTKEMPEDALPDPRHPALGWRAYREGEESDDGSNWDAIRVAHCIPASGVELTPDTFILEARLQDLNGVDFRKGCYVGQEVTARMKHKTELRKGLKQVRISGDAPVGSEITANGKTVGTLFTQAGDKAIAYLRFDRVADEMHAGDAKISVS
ncbi:folate-binding protein YgfZ [Phaeobacter sp. 22II1-1F12B]|uniref:CAF17-like 4Fe-4S cluster assembly/insertion protein YgfZ n=1 Tax=Phaeobacter sp. 22II1-1F12B TaxID=1317111 RepID=UPI000B526A6E|nr:folate-binding protein YgfZ [Phaeobacter sp. 22II1-1F12B]OWU76360.1 aminomethyltransferase [Phaeobacter sp. 22II1-1F12B]